MIYSGRVVVKDAIDAVHRRIGSPSVVEVLYRGRCRTIFHHGRGTEIPAFPQEAVDTNGAGDTHTGVLLAERALGADWESAATRANAAAAIAVTRWGTEGAPGRAEVDEFLS